MQRDRLKIPCFLKDDAALYFIARDQRSPFAKSTINLRYFLNSERCFCVKLSFLYLYEM